MPVSNPELIKQVHFSGEAQCEEFRANPHRPNFCAECNKLFDKHTPDSFESDDCLLQVRIQPIQINVGESLSFIKALGHGICLAGNYAMYSKLRLLVCCVYPVLQAIAYSQKHEKVPDCILQAEGTLGGLYQGGMQSVMNLDMLKSCGITHVVNTAKGLDIFGPKFPVRTTGIQKSSTV